MQSEGLRFARSTIESLFHREVYSLIEITKGYFIYSTECRGIFIS